MAGNRSGITFFLCFFIFRGPVLRTRCERNLPASFFWAYWCSGSRCSRFLAGFSVDAHTFAAGTILMPHGRKHDLPKPYERLPEASQKRDRGLPGGSKPTPNQKRYFPNTARQSPPRDLWTLPKNCHKPSKSFPKASQKAAQSLPKRIKTTRQILVANVVKAGAGIPLKQSAGDSREPAAPP